MYPTEFPVVGGWLFPPHEVLGHFNYTLTVSNHTE